MIKKNLFFLAFLLLLQSTNSLSVFQLDTAKKYSVCAVIPAYNEEKRITKTLDAYIAYFETIPYLNVTLLVVANNCSDNTVAVCQAQQQKHKEIQLLNLIPGGKGFAIKKGFEEALKTKYDLIGFVDADMAFDPACFHELILETHNHDGAIASRYRKGSVDTTVRPFFTKVSRKIFKWVVRKRFNFKFQDTQCGAKVFTRDTVEKITPDMVENKWCFDIELLYLCTINHKDIAEIPVTIGDQPAEESHVKINGALIKEFLGGPSRILNRHKKRAKQYIKEVQAQKKQESLAKKAAVKEKRAQQKQAAQLKRKSKKQQRAAKKMAKKQQKTTALAKKNASKNSLCSQASLI